MDAREQLATPVTIAEEIVSFAIETVIVTVTVSIVIAALIPAIGWRRSALCRRKRRAVVPHFPEHVEGIAFRAALRVFDAHDSRSATLGRAHQSLTPASVHTRKPEACGIDRHGHIAHKPPPLRRPAFQVA